MSFREEYDSSCCAVLTIALQAAVRSFRATVVIVITLLLLSRCLGVFYVTGRSAAYGRRAQRSVWLLCVGGKKEGREEAFNALTLSQP